MIRQRKTIAVACIALVVFAAFLPCSLAQVVWAPLVALWLIVPAFESVLVARRATRSADQPVSLLSLVLLRAPPASRLLA